jgi:hypothetical protein
LERHRKLAGIASKMALDKEVMGKGRKRKVTLASEDQNKAIFKWKRERKK